MASGEYIPSTAELELAASKAAAFYMESGTEHVDRQFGAGYAKAHPELVGAFMEAAARIYSANRIKNVGAALDGIANNILVSRSFD